MEQDEVDLGSNLKSLESQLHRESYRPNPNLRVDIPKGKSKTRPLGIVCIEEKLVQRASRLNDLIAKGRTLAAVMHRRQVIAGSRMR